MTSEEIQNKIIDLLKAGDKTYLQLREEFDNSDKPFVWPNISALYGADEITIVKNIERREALYAISE